jgi:prevent-host-death family protein
MRVSIRTLKTHLSEYVSRARQGETVIVTSHGRIVAQLTPPPATGPTILERLAAQSWVRVGKVGTPLGLREAVPLRGEGPTMSELLREERE